MKRSELIFPRPAELQASTPAEARGIARDEARLMVSLGADHQHARFYDLAHFLQPGDLLVVNHSATLPASLPAAGSPGSFILNLSTNLGRGLWIAEPRWNAAQPGPLPLARGETIEAGGLSARLVAPYPDVPRLWFVQLEGDVHAAMAQHGQPIRYGYVQQVYPLETYQTIFSRIPGSAEMPSAAYPFTERVMASVCAKGVQIAGIVLHTGVSSLEVETDEVEQHPLYPEVFEVPQSTADAVNQARRSGRRVIAVGTTVVRALEAAYAGGQVRPMRGFTRLYIHPRRGVHTIDGLITGLHDPVTSHLAMLYAIAGREVIMSAYHAAVRERYFWHEFGDSHLILPGEPALEIAA